MGAIHHYLDKDGTPGWSHRDPMPTIEASDSTAISAAIAAGNLDRIAVALERIADAYVKHVELAPAPAPAPAPALKGGPS